MNQDINPAFLKPLLLPRTKDSHKGNYGKALIIAGSQGMTGAAVLCAKAALKAGAGLVTVACPDTEQSVIAAALPETMTFSLPSKSGALAAQALGALLIFQESKNYDVCLIGPGLSLGGEVPGFVRSFLQKSKLPAVVDADALNVLARGNLEFLKSGPPRIFTPHSGEAGRFFKDEKLSGEELLKKLQSLLGGVCILKGPGTLVCDGIKLARNTSGGPVLAKGGSGGVLAGLITGLWAQSGIAGNFDAGTAFESAALGVYLHGLCGDLAVEKFTERCVLAGELLDFLPAAFRKTELG